MELVWQVQWVVHSYPHHLDLPLHTVQHQTHWSTPTRNMNFHRNIIHTVTDAAHIVYVTVGLLDCPTD